VKSRLVKIFLGCISALSVVATLYGIFVSGNLIYIVLCISIFIIGLMILIKDLLRPSLIIQCNKLGIIDAYCQKNSDKNEKYLNQRILDANKIDLFFTTGQGFFNKYQAVIVEAMRRNRVEIRTIVGERDSVFLNGVSEIENKYGERVKKRDINKEINTTEDFILDLRKRAEGKGQIELKHFKTEFRTSMILIESDTEKWGLITLTTPPFKAAESVAFVIKDTKDENVIYKQCEKHFENVWKIL
jgi:hypothetical protein